VSSSDAGGAEDVLPPIDVARPQDVVSECPDAGSTLVYLVSEQGNLMSFYPPAATFRTIGHLSCPASAGETPFSMAVDQQGIAYVLFADTSTNPSGTGAELFRVSTATAACRATRFASGQPGFPSTFGMGYSGNAPLGGETLYIASDTDPSQLGSLDTSTFAVRLVGPFVPQTIVAAELTGTGAGDLFAFYSLAAPGSLVGDSAIGQLDKKTGRVTGRSVLPGLTQGRAWAFAFWGGDFYTFTAPVRDSATRVTRFRPSDGSIVQVAQSGELITGAGVSTCAPQG
jgi:hypothetical protein